MYKIKHKLTGLYYQPNKDSNLSVSGKVYQTAINGVFTNNVHGYIICGAKEGSEIASLLSQYYNQIEYNEELHQQEYIIPISDFELDYNF